MTGPDCLGPAWCGKQGGSPEGGGPGWHPDLLVTGRGGVMNRPANRLEHRARRGRSKALGTPARWRRPRRGSSRAHDAGWRCASAAAVTAATSTARRARLWPDARG
jgi:hypothetical protein